MCFDRCFGIEKMRVHFADATEVGRDAIEGDLSNVGMISVERRNSPQRGGTFWMGPKDSAENSHSIAI